MTDHVREYTLDVTRRDLLNMVHRDAIPEADGPAMISQWRVHMPYFWNVGHNKYMIVGHRMMVGNYEIAVDTYISINFKSTHLGLMYIYIY